jgi:hypothetical protein
MLRHSAWLDSFNTGYNTPSLDMGFWVEYRLGVTLSSNAKLLLSIGIA